MINDFTIEEWKLKLEEYNYCCVYCHVQDQQLHQDHVVPVAKGGGYTWDNIVPACKPCNSSKAAKSLLEFIEYKYGDVEEFKFNAPLMIKH